MRHMAELRIASPQEQALQLCGHPPGPSNLRGSYGGLLVAWALVWVPGGDSATCTGVSVHTRTRSSLLLPRELAFGCYFGMIFWVRWKLVTYYILVLQFVALKRVVGLAAGSLTGEFPCCRLGGVVAEQCRWLKSLEFSGYGACPF